MLLVASFRSVAQGGAVAGQITDENNQGLRSAIMLTDSGKVKYATLTDANGNFTIASVKAGKYDLKATTVNYKDGFIKGIVVENGKTGHFHIQLTPVVVVKNDKLKKSPPPPSAMKEEYAVDQSYYSGLPGNRVYFQIWKLRRNFFCWSSTRQSMKRKIQTSAIPSSVPVIVFQLRNPFAIAAALRAA